MRSPVVFGIKKSIAEELGWINKRVLTRDILKAATEGKLRFTMTSATQSNSGASAFLGFAHAMAGEPDVLDQKHVKDENMIRDLKALLSTVSRSSGSSGWLKSHFVEFYDRYDAMVNYEAMIIEANNELSRLGKETLYAIYPADGLMMADHPLGFFDRGVEGRQQTFESLQQYLLSSDVQNQILELGRRTGFTGLRASGSTTAFKKENGM